MQVTWQIKMKVAASLLRVGRHNRHKLQSAPVFADLENKS
jgi:hypothetical protein